MIPHPDTDGIHRHRNSKILAGIFVVLFGVIFLFERQGAPIPHWLLSWKMFLIAAGIVHLYRQTLRSFFGWAMIGVGGAFLTNDFWPNTIDKQLLLPILVILFGVMMIFKHTKHGHRHGLKKKVHHTTIFDDDREITPDDYIKASTFFGGITKHVVSKSFEGGQFKTVFGGAEINLTKADIQHPIEIEATTVFGGITLIVPSNWQVRSDMTTIAGSVEDQRGMGSDVTYDPNKTVVLTGTCLFGGVEIRSYV